MIRKEMRSHQCIFPPIQRKERRNAQETQFVFVLLVPFSYWGNTRNHLNAQASYQSGSSAILAIDMCPVECVLPSSVYRGYRIIPHDRAPSPFPSPALRHFVPLNTWEFSRVALEMQQPRRFDKRTINMFLDVSGHRRGKY